MANKLLIYYIKCPFWPQNLTFEATGSAEQLEIFKKKHLNSFKTLTKSLKCFWICLKVEKRFLQLLGTQSEVASPSGTNQKLNFFFIGIEVLGAIISVKCSFSSTASKSAGQP